MQKNISDKERIFRLVTGSFLASMAFWGPRKKWMLSLLIPALEGGFGVCLMYSALGLSTRDKKETDARSNRYFPVQSDSERAAGHPIVGVS